MKENNKKNRATLYVCSQSVMSKLCDPMDCSPPGSSVRGDSPDKNTEVGCHALLQGSSQPRNQTQVSRIAAGFFIVWATREIIACYFPLFSLGSLWESSLVSGVLLAVIGLAVLINYESKSLYEVITGWLQIAHKNKSPEGKKRYRKSGEGNGSYTSPCETLWHLKDHGFCC